MAPSNDNFASSRTVSGQSGTFTCDPAGATTEPGEPPLSSREYSDDGDPHATTWYRWTAPVTGKFVFQAFDIDENAPYVYPQVNVFTGGSLGALTEVTALAKDENRVLFSASAGSIYRVRVALTNDTDAVGVYVLSWMRLSPPPNDNLARAVVLRGERGATTKFNLDAATTESGEPLGFRFTPLGGPFKSAWFKWTCPVDGVAVFRSYMDQTDYSWAMENCRVTVWTTSVTGTPTFSDLVEIRSNWQNKGFLNWNVAPFACAKGKTYWIQASANAAVDYLSDDLVLHWNSSTEFTSASPRVGEVIGEASGVGTNRIDVTLTEDVLAGDEVMGRGILIVIATKEDAAHEVGRGGSFGANDFKLYARVTDNGTSQISPPYIGGNMTTGSLLWRTPYTVGADGKQLMLRWAPLYLVRADLHAGDVLTIDYTGTSFQPIDPIDEIHVRCFYAEGFRLSGPYLGYPNQFDFYMNTPGSIDSVASSGGTITEDTMNTFVPNHTGWDLFCFVYTTSSSSSPDSLSFSWSGGPFSVSEFGHFSFPGCGRIGYAWHNFYDTPPSGSPFVPGHGDLNTSPPPVSGWTNISLNFAGIGAAYPWPGEEPEEIPTTTHVVDVTHRTV